MCLHLRFADAALGYGVVEVHGIIISMNYEKSVTKQCQNCGNDFRARPRSIRKGNAKYCGMTCYHAARWGHNGKCANCGEAASTKFCSPNCQKDYWNKNGYVRHSQRIWERKIELINSLGGKCSKCGNDDVRVLDINHIDRSKKRQPKKKQYSWHIRFRDWAENKGNLEILCVNCHRIHTWEQMGYGTNKGI